jgi:hypothetical protein
MTLHADDAHGTALGPVSCLACDDEDYVRECPALDGPAVSTELCKVYRPNEYHRDSVMHRSNHDPLWLHKFGQAGYVTPIDYGQHVAREWFLQYAYRVTGAAEAAREQDVLAKAGLSKPGPHKAAETFA